MLRLTFPAPRSLLLAAVALVLTTLLAVRFLMPREPLRILIVTEEPGPGDFSRKDLAPLLVFTTDLLEAGMGAAVTLTRDPPSQEAFRRSPKRGLMVRLRARREGDRLHLAGAWIRIADYVQGASWNLLATSPAPPGEALEALLGALPIPRRKGPRVVPTDPAAFWDLLQAQNLSRYREHREAAIALAQASLAREPENPSAHRLLGHLYYQRAAAREPSAAADVVACREHLEASLQQHPAYPRAASDWLGFMADTGAARDALARFAAFKKANPDAIPLYTGLGYTARYAGHMQALEKATARIEALHLFPDVPWRLQIGLLHLGRQSEYAASLRDYPGDLRNSLVIFLRGHLAYIQGRRPEALALFREGEKEASGFPHFVQLSAIFSKALGGDQAGARQALEAMERERQGLLTPDGEVTLHLAEAYCLLGDADHGLDLMERAFSHGFGSTAWFEADPLLEPARGLPRWRVLQRHLQERQALIEARFPMDQLGF